MEPHCLTTPTIYGYVTREAYITARGSINQPGEWSMGRKNGQGKMTYTNGDVYNGSWVNDFREGKGQFTSLDKSIKYDGDWKDDVMEGTGVYIKPGFKYEGELRGGRLYGQGNSHTPTHHHTPPHR
jgi:hypothetical protein